MNRPLPLGRYSLYLTPSASRCRAHRVRPRLTPKATGVLPLRLDTDVHRSAAPTQSARQHSGAWTDGIEVQATEAGAVLVPLAGGTRLRVLRIPSGEEEYDLEIFFRDDSNGHGSYPAGRFVTLIPQQGGRYRLDFNRARNPFCAYNTVYPCPAPWPGNVVHAAIEAGERYTGGGLESAARQARGPVMLLGFLAALAIVSSPSPAGSWRAVLDLQGGPLRFGLQLERGAHGWKGRLCNGSQCQPLAVTCGRVIVSL